MALVMMGCGAVGAEEPPAVVSGVPVIEVAAPAQAEPAIDVIVAAYEHMLGIDMSSVPLRIHWTPSLPGQLLGATMHGGFGCSTWILDGAMWNYPRVLPHEIGHCARWLLTGDGDPEHTDAAWWSAGGLADQAHAAEAAAGY